jgi:hypothetical protein
MKNNRYCRLDVYGDAREEKIARRAEIAMEKRLNEYDCDAERAGTIAGKDDGKNRLWWGPYAPWLTSSDRVRLGCATAAEGKYTTAEALTRPVPVSRGC